MPGTGEVDLYPGPALIIQADSGSPIDAEVVTLIDVTVVDDAGQEVGQKYSEPEKLAKCSFGKEVNDKVKKGVFIRKEEKGLYVQLGAGKKKQILADYPLHPVNIVQGTEKIAIHSKTVNAFYETLIDQYSKLEDRLTGFNRPHGDYVPRRFKVVDTGPCNLELMFKYNSCETFMDLAQFLSDPSPDRYHKEHQAQPVLLYGPSFCGKSIVLRKLMHQLAVINREAGWVGTVPMVPMLIELRRLAPFIAGGRKGEKPGPEALINYIDECCGADAAVLKAHVKMRAAVILIDSFDDAIELETMENAMHFVFNGLVGQRVVLASRLINVLDAPEWSKTFMRMQLEPLSAPEQQIAIDLALKQLGKEGGAALPHLCAFAELREKHDALYTDKVPATERRKLEGVQSIDRFCPGGAYVAELRQVTLGIEKTVQYNETALEFPKSDYLKALIKQVDKWKAIDRLDDEIKATLESLRDPLAIKQALLDEASAISIVERVCNIKVNEFDACHHFFARLCQLVHKRKTYKVKKPPGSSDPIEAMSCPDMWVQLCGRTDEMYAVVEKYEEGAQFALLQRLLSCPELKNGLDQNLNPGDSPSSSSVGELRKSPLMDPCKLHDKAVDEFLTRFSDGSLAEANVTDMVRTTLLLYENKGASLAGVLKELKRPVDVRYNAYNVQMETLSLRNQYAQLDPNHYRCVILVIKCTFAPLEAKKNFGYKPFIYLEVELTYAPALRLEQTGGSREHMEGIRAALRARYDEVPDKEMQSMLTFIGRLSGNPMMLNLLSLNFHKEGLQKEVALPRGMPDLVESAVNEFLALQLGEDEVSNAHQLLFSIAEILRSADGRGVSPDDIEKKLKLLTKGRGEINMWRKLYSPPTEHSPGTMLPLLKNANIDGKSSVIFNLPAVTYAFHIDMLAEECARSMDTFQRYLNSPIHMRSLRFGAGRLAERIARRLSDWIFNSLTTTAFETLLIMLDPEGQYIAECRLRSLCLPGDLCNQLGTKQMTQIIESVNKLKFITKVSVNGTWQWLDIGQVKGYAHSHLLHMSGQAESGRMSAGSASVVCGLALENFGVSDLNLSRNDFYEVGARAATRLLMTNDRLQRVDLHDCKLGCLGIQEVGKGISACASGVPLNNVVLAFNLRDDEDSRANAAELTKALSSLFSSPLCPLELNLKANNLGTIFAPEQFSQVANSIGGSSNALVNLNLSVNDLSDTFGEALGNAVGRNGTLTALNVSTNRLAEKASSAFANAITSSRCALKSLNLVNNRLGISGGLRLAEAIDSAAELGEAAMGLLGNKGSLDLRTNNFGKAVWPLLAACDALKDVKIQLDAHLVTAYTNTSPITKLNYSEAMLRPRSAAPGGRDAFGGLGRPSTAQPVGRMRPSTRPRPGTAPSNQSRGRADLFTEAAVNDVVEKQTEAGAALLDNLMQHQAWVESKVDSGGKGGPGSPDTTTAWMP